MSENLTSFDSNDARCRQVGLDLEVPVTHADKNGCTGPLPDAVVRRVGIPPLMLSDLYFFGLGEETVTDDDGEIEATKVSCQVCRDRARFRSGSMAIDFHDGSDSDG